MKDKKTGDLQQRAASGNTLVPVSGRGEYSRVYASTDCDLDPRLLAQLWNEIEYLHQEDREILRLCVAEHLHYGDIAIALSIPVDTVKRRIVTARERMRSNLTSLLST